MGEPRRASRSSERLARVRVALDNVRSTCDVAARLELDPVAVVHRYAAPEDRELVGLIASAVAFANVKALRAKLEEALERLGPNIAAAADDPRGAFASLRGWKHRVYGGEDWPGSSWVRAACSGRRDRSGGASPPTSSGKGICAPL